MPRTGAKDDDGPGTSGEAHPPWFVDNDHDIRNALMRRVRDAADAAGVGGLLDPRVVIDDAAQALGATGVKLLMRDRGLRTLLLRYAYWSRLRTTAPFLRREELARQLATAAGAIEQQHDILMEGCWLEGVQLHPWLYNRVGSSLGLPWAVREYEEMTIDDGEVVLVPTREMGDGDPQPMPPLRKAKRPREPENPMLDAARRAVSHIGLELLGRLAEDLGTGRDRVESHVTDILVGHRARTRDPVVMHYAFVEEARANQDNMIAVEGNYQSPGIRALLSVAAHCQFEIASGVFDLAAQLKSLTSIDVDESVFSIVVRKGSEEAMGLLDAVARKMRSYEQVRRRFVSFVTPLFRRASGEGDRAGDRTALASSPKADGAARESVSPARPPAEKYDVPAGTRWHQIVIELTGDPEELGVRFGSRRLPPLTPATIGMLDGRRDNSRPKPAWSVLMALLTHQFDRARRRAPPPERRAAARKMVERVRSALRRSFPGVDPKEDPLPYVLGEGWVPAFTVDDARERI
ncbi:MAG: hypothetical protein IT460_05025 [Planctomycetes bacterium]|nr:hypothetical protein [Planctomycetota bacterium]